MIMVMTTTITADHDDNVEYLEEIGEICQYSGSIWNNYCSQFEHVNTVTDDSNICYIDDSNICYSTILYLLMIAMYVPIQYYIY